MSPKPAPFIGTAPWRDDAVSAVANELYRLNPGMTERFGPRGLKACREDLQHHLEYLDGALATGETSIITGYAQWLKTILDSRGVPNAHLAQSFDLLAGFFRERVQAEDARRIAAVLAAARDALEQNDCPAPYLHARLPALAEAPHYSRAALAGRHREAQQFMSEAMASGHSLVEASVRLIQPAMLEIGRLWQENRITVAQEHLATATTQSVLARSYLQAEFAPPTGRRAVFAAVEGNHHGLGLRILSDAFETRGWDAVYLGADVPTHDLIKEVDARKPELVCLSLALPSHLAVARLTVERLRAELGNRCPTLWVGGLATLAGKEIWRSLKADGWAADALEALEQVKS